MTFRLAILASAASLGAALIAPSAQAKPMADVTYATVFFKQSVAGANWTDLPLAMIANDPLLRAIPERAGQYAMIALRCRSLHADGSLGRCKVEADPPLPAYQAVGKAIAASLKTKPAFARATRTNVAFISIHVRLSNSATPAQVGPCWPPICVPIPPPPPPPPRAGQ